MRNLIVLAVIVSGAIAVSAHREAMPSEPDRMADKPKMNMMTPAEKVSSSHPASPAHRQ